MDRESAQKLVDLMELPEFENIIDCMDAKFKHFNIIKAYAKGAEVQLRSGSSDDWGDIESPNFNAVGLEYRVKPAQAVVWFRVYKTEAGLIGVWVEDTLDALFDTSCLPYPDCEWVNSPACTEVDRLYRSFK